MNYFDVLMELLRDRPKFLTDVNNGFKIDRKIVSLLISSSIFLSLYGAIIGSFNGGLQMVSSAIKLPALYLITMIICMPTLYFFDIISGSKRTFGQYAVLLLSCMSLISVTLLGFAPVSLFFRLSTNDYDFFRLLNIIIFVITGFIGINFFYKAMQLVTNEKSSEEANVSPNRNKIMKAWLFLYGFVGSQLAWTLRPFFSSPGESFALFREIESNFYIEVIKILNNVMGFSN
jgi:hypothetical protein